MAFDSDSLLFKVEKIHLNIDTGFLPKQPLLKYDLIVKNNNFYDIKLEYLRIKIIVTDVEDLFENENILLKASQKTIFNIEKTLDLFNFSKSTFSYFVKMEAYKYKIRGICKIKEEFYKIKSDSKNKEK